MITSLCLLLKCSTFNKYRYQVKKENIFGFAGCTFMNFSFADGRDGPQHSKFRFGGNFRKLNWFQMFPHLGEDVSANDAENRFGGGKFFDDFGANYQETFVGNWQPQSQNRCWAIQY